MRLFNPFKAFGPRSSQDIQSAGEDDIAVFPQPSSRKRRRLKRRPTRQIATGWQAEETKSLSGIQIPDARNQGFRSAPDLLGEHQVRDRWSPIPGQSAAKAPNSRLRENFDGSPWREYEQTFPTHPPPQNADPPRDDQYSEQIDTPIFGPREQGFFRNEMPYDMDSPLSQLASGWREPPHSAPRVRKLPTPPIRDSLDMYGMSSGYSKEIPPQLRDSPEGRSTYRSISPEVGSRHSSEIASAHFRESPSEWRRSPEIRPPQRSRTVSPEASFRRDSRSQHNSNAVDGTYYIVPGGVDVIFQDGNGNEITRVGDFGHRSRSGEKRNGETNSHNSRRARDDEQIGHERSGRRNPRSRSYGSELSDSDTSRGRSQLPTVVLIDRQGRQIPIYSGMPFVSDRRSK